MEAQGRSWRHHFVPAWHLSNFGAPAERKRKALLWCFDIKDGKQFTATADKVGYKEDFNTALVNGEPTDYFEKKTRELEKLIVPRIEIFRQKPSHEKDGLFWVLAAIALMAGKNPATRSRLVEATEDEFYRGAAELVSSRERYEMFAQASPLFGLVLPHMSFEDAKRCIETRSLDPVVQQNYMLYLELTTISDMVKTCLLPRRWRVFQTDPDATGGFITTDNPVVRRMERDGKPCRGFGVGRNDTMIAFAVSRELAVIGEFQGEEGFRPAGIKEVAWFNNTAIAHCNRQIYALNDQFNYDFGGRIRAAVHLAEDLALFRSTFTQA